MLEKLILENEQQIKRFELDYYLKQKNYPVAAALAALDTTNQIQKCYFELDKIELSSEAILRLYALLQSLFVSIDSLYSLAYSLTKSKGFININKNPELRELKFIRNDVVGHPANRIYNATTLAYCILDSSSITKDSFSYHIYSGKGVEEKKIDVDRMVLTFYQESNALLQELFDVAKKNRTMNRLVSIAMQALDHYSMDGDYQTSLDLLKQQYLKQYVHANSHQHRVLWRLELIEELQQFHTDHEQVEELVHYAIGLEIVKLYQLLSGKVYDVSLRKKTPYLVSCFYRFLNKQKAMLQYIDKITDMKHPLFKSSMQAMKEKAEQIHNEGVLAYLSLLEDLYVRGEDGLLYSLSLPIREYKKRK